MRYLIIGLGIYGENLARDLTANGHEVIGCDSRQSRIDSIKDDLASVYLIDSTEENQLMVLPLKNVDVVIVAIGENFGASVKTVALLKKAGVEHIFARAIDRLHEAILDGFDIDRILTPEQTAATILATELDFGKSIRAMKVDENHVIMTVFAPSHLVGLTYTELRDRLSTDFGITFITACRSTEKRNVLGIRQNDRLMIDFSSPDPVFVDKNDTITILGARKSIHALARRLSN